MTTKPIQVRYHDHGVLLSWPSGDPGIDRAIHLSPDDAVPFAHALQAIIGGEIERRTGAFKVQWYDSGVLFSHSLDGEPRYAHLPMADATAVANAILRAVDDRDVLVIHDGDIQEGNADDFDY